MDHLDCPSLVILNGIPDSGKTHLMRYMLLQDAMNKKIDWVVVISPSCFTGSFDMVPRSCRRSTWDEHFVREVLLIQKRERKRLLFIIDDGIGFVGFGTKLFTHIIAMFRHYNCKFLIATQNVCKLPVIARDCSTHVVMFQSYVMGQLKNLYLNYGTHFSTFEEFRKYLKYATDEPHQFILYTKKPPIDSNIPVYQILMAPAKIPRYRLSNTQEIDEGDERPFKRSRDH